MKFMFYQKEDTLLSRPKTILYIAQIYLVFFERCRRQRSEQYFTSSQQLAHFLRQLKGR